VWPGGEAAAAVVVVVVVVDEVVVVAVAVALQTVRLTGVDVDTVEPAEGVWRTTLPRVLTVHEVVVDDETVENPCCVSVDLALARLVLTTFGTEA
jgi:hypothetical protein